MKKWPFERAGGLTVFCVVGTFLHFILNDPLYRSLLFSFIFSFILFSLIPPIKYTKFLRGLGKPSLVFMLL